MVRREPDVSVDDSEARAAMARNVAYFRTKMGLTQARLAAEVGMRRATINSIERTGRADQQSIERLARHFSVPVATMWELDPDLASVSFLAAQIDGLSSTNFEALTRLSRALASRATNDKIGPTPRKGSR